MLFFSSPTLAAQFTTYIPNGYFVLAVLKCSGKIIIALIKKLSLLRVFVGVLNGLDSLNACLVYSTAFNASLSLYTARNAYITFIQGRMFDYVYEQPGL